MLILNAHLNMYGMDVLYAHAIAHVVKQMESMPFSKLQQWVLDFLHTALLKFVGS